MKNNRRKKIRHLLVLTAVVFMLSAAVSAGTGVFLTEPVPMEMTVQAASTDTSEQQARHLDDRQVFWIAIALIAVGAGGMVIFREKKDDSQK